MTAKARGQAALLVRFAVVRGPAGAISTRNSSPAPFSSHVAFNHFPLRQAAPGQRDPPMSNDGVNAYGRSTLSLVAADAVPKGRQDLAVGFSRRMEAHKLPSPEGTAEPGPRPARAPASRRPFRPCRSIRRRTDGTIGIVHAIDIRLALKAHGILAWSHVCRLRARLRERWRERSRVMKIWPQP